ncbi:hypothetical protein [Nocardia sp. NPDC051750]|uniref:hypothetical protein n=1 Tax=Nocardia sp. NPDC051750 TaxID=3364325 RepID=UPI0037924BF5
MSAPEMVLQYINALKWPVVAALAISFFHTPARALLGQVQRLRVAAFGAEAEVERQAQDFAREVSAAGSEDGQPRRESVLDDGLVSDRTELEQPRSVRVSRSAAAIHVLTADSFRNLEMGIDGLKRFSFNGEHGVQLIAAAGDRLADAIIRLASQLDVLVDQTGGQNLFPGTPKHLRDLFLSVYKIRNTAVHQGDASPMAAHQFNVGVRNWARLYADHLQAAVEEASLIPLGASVEVEDDRTDTPA